MLIDTITPVIAVHDIDETLDFYTNGLGFAIAEKGDEDQVWFRIEYGPISLVLRETDLKTDHRIELYLTCSDALQVYDEFSSKKLMLDEPYVKNKKWIVRVKDPDGNSLYYQSDADYSEGTRFFERFLTN